MTKNYLGAGQYGLAETEYVFDSGKKIVLNEDEEKTFCEESIYVQGIKERNQQLENQTTNDALEIDELQEELDELQQELSETKYALKKLQEESE